MGKLEEKMLSEFLQKKENLLSEFSSLLNVEKFNYTIDELILFEENIKSTLNNERVAELYNIYIGEVILKNIEGEWSIGKIKKDPAYHKPIILKKDKNKMRLCPIADWFGLLNQGRLNEGISGMVNRVIAYDKKV